VWNEQPAPVPFTPPTPGGIEVHGAVLTGFVSVSGSALTWVAAGCATAVHVFSMTSVSSLSTVPGASSSQSPPSSGEPAGMYWSSSPSWLIHAQMTSVPALPLLL
jgi:hypothetical protein